MLNPPQRQNFHPSQDGVRGLPKPSDGAQREFMSAPWLEEHTSERFCFEQFLSSYRMVKTNLLFQRRGGAGVARGFVNGEAGAELLDLLCGRAARARESARLPGDTRDARIENEFHAVLAVKFAHNLPVLIDDRPMRFSERAKFPSLTGTRCYPPVHGELVRCKGTTQGHIV